MSEKREEGFKRATSIFEQTDIKLKTEIPAKDLGHIQMIISQLCDMIMIALLIMRVEPMSVIKGLRIFVDSFELAYIHDEEQIAMEDLKKEKMKSGGA